MTPQSLIYLASITLGLVLLAGNFDNHLWRFICCGMAKYLWFPTVATLSESPLVTWISWLLLCFILIKVPHLRKPIKRQGSVFITGADSGMVSESSDLCRRCASALISHSMFTLPLPSLPISTDVALLPFVICSTRTHSHNLCTALFTEYCTK